MKSPCAWGYFFSGSRKDEILSGRKVGAEVMRQALCSGAAAAVQSFAC